jgi:hypothetical protein
MPRTAAWTALQTIDEGGGKTDLDASGTKAAQSVKPFPPVCPSFWILTHQHIFIPATDRARDRVEKTSSAKSGTIQKKSEILLQRAPAATKID